jgi:hypothetical protein
MHHYSASGRKRGKTCLWWARPDVTLDAKTTNEAMALGTAFHSCAQYTIENQPVDVVAIATENGLSTSATRDLCDMYETWLAWFKAQPAKEWFTEVALAYDTATDTARMLPTEGQRDYSKALPTEIPGTVDAYTFEEGALVVYDWKTGRAKHNVDGYLTQLEHGALSLARVFNVDEARVKICHVTTTEVRESERVIDPFDLQAAAWAMTSELNSIAGAEPVEGSQCDWCPAKASCPKTQTVVAEVQANVGVRLPMLGAEVQDDATAIALLAALPRLEAWLKQQWASLEAYATKKPVPLPEGKLWGRLEKPGRERIDLDVSGAVGYLRESLGACADVAIEQSTSKAAIDRAVKRLLAPSGGGKRGEQKKRVVAVLENLRELGAIKRSANVVTFETFEESAQETESEKEGDE